ncbi:hypothetical protein DsansV1_C07g0070541 [Dioscorea sansibarensis]
MPLESTFSAINRVFAEKRSTMTPACAELSICFDDWLDAANRVQHCYKLTHNSRAQLSVLTYQLVWCYQLGSLPWHLIKVHMALVGIPDGAACSSRIRCLNEKGKEGIQSAENLLHPPSVAIVNGPMRDAM